MDIILYGLPYHLPVKIKLTTYEQLHGMEWGRVYACETALMIAWYSTLDTARRYNCEHGKLASDWAHNQCIVIQ